MTVCRTYARRTIVSTLTVIAVIIFFSTPKSFFLSLYSLAPIILHTTFALASIIWRKTFAYRIEDEVRDPNSR